MTHDPTDIRVTVLVGVVSFLVNTGYIIGFSSTTPTLTAALSVAGVGCSIYTVYLGLRKRVR